MSLTVVGTRVVRGPDWQFADQDGGEGHLGTVVSIGKGFMNPHSNILLVCWDVGNIAEYRAGFNEKYDLLVYDNAGAGIKHYGVTCDECGENDVVGMRWKCSSCYDYDLCNKCYMTSKHNLEHAFNRITIPGSVGTPMPPRAAFRKIQAKGLFPGAKVCRGKDWQWKQQDGGKGNIGEVLMEAPWTNVQRSAVKVEWHSHGAYTYRVGHNGKVDIKCLQAGEGYAYYKDHLPKFGESDSLEIGDRVAVKLGKDVLKAPQENHGGWKPEMEMSTSSEDAKMIQTQFASKVAMVGSDVPQSDLPQPHRVPPVVQQPAPQQPHSGRTQSTSSEEAKRIQAQFASKVAMVASDLPQADLPQLHRVPPVQQPAPQQPQTQQQPPQQQPGVPQPLPQPIPQQIAMQMPQPGQQVIVMPVGPGGQPVVPAGGNFPVISPGAAPVVAQFPSQPVEPGVPEGTQHTVVAATPVAEAVQPPRPVPQAAAAAAVPAAVPGQNPVPIQQSGVQGPPTQQVSTEAMPPAVQPPQNPASVQVAAVVAGPPQTISKANNPAVQQATPTPKVHQPEIRDAAAAPQESKDSKKKSQKKTAKGSDECKTDNVQKPTSSQENPGKEANVVLNPDVKVSKDPTKEIVEDVGRSEKSKETTQPQEDKGSTEKPDDASQSDVAKKIDRKKSMVSEKQTEVAVVPDTTIAKLDAEEKPDRYDATEDRENVNGADSVESENLENKEGKPNPKDNKIQLKYAYREDQWSPANPEGKKQYDRDFLLQFQKGCTDNPDGLPNIPDIVLDKAVVRPLSLNINQGGNQKSSDFMPHFMKSPRVKDKQPNYPTGQGRRSSQKPLKVIHKGRDSAESKLATSNKAWKPGYKRGPVGSEYEEATGI